MGWGDVVGAVGEGLGGISNAFAARRIFGQESAKQAALEAQQQQELEQQRRLTEARIGEYESLEGERARKARQEDIAQQGLENYIRNEKLTPEEGEIVREQGIQGLVLHRQKFSQITQFWANKAANREFVPGAFRSEMANAGASPDEIDRQTEMLMQAQRAAETRKRSERKENIADEVQKTKDIFDYERMMKKQDAKTKQSAAALDKIHSMDAALKQGRELIDLMEQNGVGARALSEAEQAGQSLEVQWQWLKRKHFGVLPPNLQEQIFTKIAAFRTVASSVAPRGSRSKDQLEKFQEHLPDQKKDGPYATYLRLKEAMDILDDTREIFMKDPVERTTEEGDVADIPSPGPSPWKARSTPGTPRVGLTNNPANAPAYPTKYRSILANLKPGELAWWRGWFYNANGPVKPGPNPQAR